MGVWFGTKVCILLYILCELCGYLIKDRIPGAILMQDFHSVMEIMFVFLDIA